MTKEVFITGGAGFVGANLVEALNARGIVPHVLDDWANLGEKWRNLRGLRYVKVTEENMWLTVPGTATLVHLAARVDTREKMNPELWENNVNMIWRLIKNWTVRGGPPKIIYASSGSVYGNEESDFTEKVEGLKPTNAYAFTKWSLDNDFSESWPSNVYSLRFMNVYGPREQAKGDMASLVHKGLTKQAPLYETVTRSETLSFNGKLNSERHEYIKRWNLFRSERPEILDGGQARDFVHVSDVVNVILHFIDSSPEAGIYNVGSGTARTFDSLVKAIDPDIEVNYVPMPESLRGQYQYYTCADLTKLRAAGYTAPFLTLEEGIEKTREWLTKNA